MVLRRFLSISVLVIKRTERLKKIRIGHLGLEGLKFMGFLGQRVWGFIGLSWFWIQPEHETVSGSQESGNCWDDGWKTKLSMP